MLKLLGSHKKHKYCDVFFNVFVTYLLVTVSGLMIIGL